MILSEEAQAVFQSMREGILIIDTQTRILFANRSYLEFLGKTETEIIGRPLREVRPGARLPEVLTTGDHAKIARWRRKQSLLRTRQRRPDLYEKLDLSSREDQKLLKELEEE